MSADFEIAASAAEVEFFRVHGYQRFDRITTDAEVAWLRELYDRILVEPEALRLHFEGVRADGTPGQIEQIFVPELRHPELLDTIFLANAQRLAAQLLGVPAEEVKPRGMLVIFKPAREGRDTPWHQDEAYWNMPDRLPHSVSAWLPLDPVTVDSGCMQFLPGSHERDVLRYRRLDAEGLLGLAETVDVQGAVACPLRAGGATFHHCRTLHYSGPNTSPALRRAISTIFDGPSTARGVPVPRPWLEQAGARPVGR